MEINKSQLQELQDQFLDFAQVAINTIGLAATIQFLNMLTGIIAEEPVLARKLANPETQVRLMDMSKEMKGKKMGPIELMGMLPKVKEIFM